MELKTYRGDCHCGAIRFEVDAAENFVAQSCNCSICQRIGFIHLIVPKNQFRLLQGQNNLNNYQFNSKVAQHYFCKTCGIKSFYVPRSNPDGVSVNVRCLDIDQNAVVIEQFDGQNWEASVEQLKHLT